MERIHDLLAQISPLPPGIMSKALLSLAAFALAALLQRLVVRLVFRKNDDVRVRYRWRKSSSNVAVVVVVVLLAAIWFRQLQTIGTFLGLVSAGLAIALKDLVADAAGWLFILIRKPMQLGDRIQIGELCGDVIDLRFFQFTILEIGGWVDSDQSTGRVIHIPNSKVLTDPLVNYARGFRFIWNELPILVTFESDWEAAKIILQEIADRHAHSLSEQAEKIVKESARQYLIVYSKLTPTVYTSVRDSGILLTIRYLCKPRQRRGTEQAIWEEVLREFAKNPNIDFAYPTKRLYAIPEDRA